MSSRVFYRANGDCLSLKFSPSGALSSAYLTVDGVSHDVTPQFPGLCVENCEEYVGYFGYSEKPRPVELPSWLLQNFSAHGLVVERVEEVRDKVLRVGVILQGERLLGCPRKILEAEVGEGIFRIIMTTDLDLAGQVLGEVLKYNTLEEY